MEQSKVRPSFYKDTRMKKITGDIGSPNLPHRLIGICDISADPGGSIEFMNECTTIDEPFCLYDADRNKDKKTFKGPGVLICSIDNMPTQLPLEATDFFGNLLYPHVNNILKSDAAQPFEGHEEEKMGSVVSGAVITSNGKLTDKFKYISDLREANMNGHTQVSGDFKSDKKVLVLGAGYVSAPVIDYLTRDPDVGVTVASALKEEANKLASRYPRTQPVLLDVAQSTEALDDLIKEHNIVLSLLPWTLHPTIAERCIALKKNMVTASYCTDPMRALHDKAVDAGITVVNEVGVDPGIDHLLAMECFDEVHTAGGKVESFISYCGGLPAPEASDNALGYKFSWSPRGALMNMLAGAKYLEAGKPVTVDPNGGLLDSAAPMTFLPGFNIEGYPNRDSTVYGELYGIPEAHTILRGTLRYRGYTDALRGLVRLGLLNPDQHPALHEHGPDITWRQFLCKLMGVAKDNIFYDNLVDTITERVGTEARTKALESLGLLSDDPVEKLGSPLDTLSRHLANRLAYEPGERDMILMRHEVVIRWPDNRREHRGINLAHYGSEKPDGYTAMASTVGFPAAIATRMVLDNEIQKKGMVLPFTRDIYKPMLERLQNEGIRATEKSRYENI